MKPRIPARLARILLWILAILIFCVLWPALEYQHFIIEPENRLKAFLQLSLYRGSWLLLPLIAFCGWRAFAHWQNRRRLRAIGAALMLLLSATTAWARFVEPNVLVVRTTIIPAPIDLDIALVADVHVGLFTRPDKLQQMVDRLNAMHVDLLLFAGDLTYDPPKDLNAALAPLRRLRKPMYAVLGNHDVQLPGPPLEAAIHLTLAGSPVIFIEHRVIDFPAFRLAGLYDYWTARDDSDFLRALPRDKPLLVLMHQPHSLQDLRGVPFALAMAGHTHGGQVRIPWLTAEVFKLARGEIHYDGYYDTPAGKLFVTRGVGITGTPVRFDCPSTIDLIELRRSGH